METSAASPPPVQPRLLLIEMDPTMCTMLTDMLAGHLQIEAVRDGLTACQAAKQNPPNLVIIDLYMPGTDNLTLIRTLRADALTAMIPIIMLTTHTYRELLLRCLTAGASNFLLKPFNMAELLTCVQVEMELRGTPH